MAVETVERQVSDDPFVVAEDGTTLAIRKSTLEIVRNAGWDHYRQSRHFSRIFYTAMEARGVSDKDVKVELVPIIKRRLELGLSMVECRLAYGIERGIISSYSGRFLKIPFDRMGKVEADLMVESKKVGFRFSADDWESVVDDALECSKKLPDSAPVQDELSWVASRMREWPDFGKAPSRMAVKFWMAANDPSGADGMERELFRILLNKRMTPGDVTAGPRKPDEDDGNDEMMSRLFGEKDA